MGRPKNLRKRRMKIHSAVLSEIDLKILRMLSNSEWSITCSISECIRHAVHEYVNREIIKILGKAKVLKQEDELEEYLRLNGIKIIGEA